MSRRTDRSGPRPPKAEPAPAPSPAPAAGESAGASPFGDEYLSHVSHELRASLNTILGWAELLRTRGFDDTGRIRAAETILRHARQQLWLITDLMDTWRLLSGTLRLNVGSVDLCDLVTSAVQAVEPVAAAKNVTFNLDIMPLSGHVQGDAQRLKQALVALLSNATHFMTSAGSVDVRLVAAPDGAELTVRDRGLAVGADALPHLFDRRRPKDAARASRRGDLGVGLSLVRDVIELHGGSAQVESDGEHGVTFTIRLPLESPPPAALAEAVWVARGGPADHPMHGRLLGLTVLLVDDEADAREVVAGILRHYGAVVVPVASVSEALAALNHERIDVLLTDIAMPEEDGYDLLRRIRTLDGNLNIPAAALTAFASEEDRQRALEAGFHVHLSKPIDPHVLVDTVETLGRRTTAQSAGR